MMTAKTERKELMEKSLAEFLKLDSEIQLIEYAQNICSRICMEQIVKVINSHTAEELMACGLPMNEIMHKVAVFLQQGVEFGFCEKKDKENGF